MSSISYARSSRCNRLQRVLAIYFKFKGLTAKGVDTLHALGLSMSSKWTTNSVEAMSVEAMKEVEALANIHASLLSYDNAYMTFRVFGQRLERDTTHAAGTAATVYIKKDAPPPDPLSNSRLQQYKRRGLVNPISAMDIISMAETSHEDVLRFEAYHVLQVLLDSAEFDLLTYSSRESPAFDPPSAVEPLPCGPGHTTLQYMLGSLPTPEATYEDNDTVISELLKQLGCQSPADLQRMGLEHILYIVGDQLTVERIRGLQRLLCQERNSFERLDFVLPVFGWLHFQMAFAKSLHKQYYGSNKGKGLQHAFTTLGRKGLERRVTQGPFHDNLENALFDVLTAHLRVCWKSASGVSKLEDLRNQTPEQLKDLAEKIVYEYADTPRAEPTPATYSFRGFRESEGFVVRRTHCSAGGLARMRTAYRAVSRGHGPIRARGLAFRGAGPYGARWYVPRSALRVSVRRIVASIPFAMGLP
ncbi:hypothetical protein C2E23DRAFT_743131 [Lenzites betulinus]|nr:hypothetical protein C2E23DRAFT_743131 [Lenzites betulinus]